MNLKLVIPGEPIAQPRTKARAFAGHAQVYTDAKHGVHAYKAAIRMIAANQHHGAPVECPLRVDCTFVFSRPKSHYRTGKHARERRPDAPFWHTKKPDKDNAEKAVLDALKGIIFADDCQVCIGETVKRYTLPDEQPHATIRILEVEQQGA